LVAQARALLTPARFKAVAEYPVVREQPAPPPRGPFAGLPEGYFTTEAEAAEARLLAGHPAPHLPAFPYATWLERACKLTEMDVRSPGFDVKLALFVPLLRVAAAKQALAIVGEKEEEEEEEGAVGAGGAVGAAAAAAPEATMGTERKLKDTVLALRAIEQCVLEREEERRVGSARGQTVRERTLIEQSYRKIVARLVSRMLSLLSSVAAPRLVLERTPPPPTDPKELFPSSGTRTMRSTRACHEAWDFLLVVSGMRTSRVGMARSKSGRVSAGGDDQKGSGGGARDSGDSAGAGSGAGSEAGSGGDNKGKGATKNMTKKKTKRGTRRAAAAAATAAAPSSPRAKPSSPLAVPGDRLPRSDFDYFGGASISARQTPLYPDSNGKASPTRRGSGRGDEAAAANGQAQAERIAVLEAQLRDSRELNERLQSQQQLIDESPESAALALDARRLMVAEARTHQLRRQIDTLLHALEGQTEVVDHAERILLELVDMGEKGLLPKKRATERGESVAARVQNLLERLRASARASARARAERLGEK
jgi:hypothetical protein